MSTTERAAHTPEPWVVERFSASGRFGVTAPHSHTIATINHNAYIPEKVHAANARRIVACVNACKGVPTDGLEAGVVREMVEALDLLRQAWVTGPDTTHDAKQLCDLRERAGQACLDVLTKVRGR